MIDSQLFRTDFFDDPENFTSGNQFFIYQTSLGTEFYFFIFLYFPALTVTELIRVKVPSLVRRKLMSNFPSKENTAFDFFDKNNKLLFDNFSLCIVISCSYFRKEINCFCKNLSLSQPFWKIFFSKCF